MTIFKFILAPVIGGLIGFLYYKLIGCSTGTCAITSSPWLSTIYGLVLGIVFASI